VLQSANTGVTLRSAETRRGLDPARCRIGATAMKAEPIPTERVREAALAVVAKYGEWRVADSVHVKVATAGAFTIALRTPLEPAVVSLTRPQACLAAHWLDIWGTGALVATLSWRDGRLLHATSSGRAHGPTTSSASAVRSKRPRRTPLNAIRRPRRAGDVVAPTTDRRIGLVAWDFRSKRSKRT